MPAAPRSVPATATKPFLIDDKRKRPQEDAFDPAEDRGVGADAEREAQDRQNGEARAAPEHAKTESEIVEHGLYLTWEVRLMSPASRVNGSTAIETTW